MHIYKSMHLCLFLQNYTAAVSEAATPHSKYVGTRFYTSPEQEKNEAYGNKVDVYALGIIYFEMMFPFTTEMERSKVIMITITSAIRLCNSYTRVRVSQIPERMC